MRNITLYLFLLLMAANASASGFESLYQSIYLGQAYPAGNIYVVPFSDIYGKEHKYPLKLTVLRAIHGELQDESVTANYQDSITAKEGEYSITAYIPGLEGMWDSHDCGVERKYKRNPVYSYVANHDFFDLSSGGCYEFGNIARYKYKASGKRSYMVLAHDQGITLEKVRLYPEESKRPMSKQDRVKREEELKEYAELEKEGQCYTENRTIADASLLMQAQLKGKPYSLRLSYYPDPGCMGHYVIKYLLDILDQKGRILESREIMAVQGVL